MHTTGWVRGGLLAILVAASGCGADAAPNEASHHAASAPVAFDLPPVIRSELRSGLDFAKVADAWTLAIRRGSAHRFLRLDLPIRAGMPARIEVGDVAGGWVEIQSDVDHAATGALQQNAAVYASAFDDADLTYVADPDRFEEFKIFRTARARVAFVTRLRVGPGLRLRSGPASSLELVDPAGVVRLRSPEPWVIDATGRRRAVPLTITETAPNTFALTGGVASEDLTPPIVLDPAWISAGVMAVSRARGHTATAVSGGRALIVGGEPGTGAEIFTLATKSWSAAGSPKLQRNGHAATRLPSGKILLTGGRSMNDATYTTEVYDPATNSFANAASMAVPHNYHTATVLADGRVLVAGGVDQAATVSTCEVYDPATGTFAAAASMNRPRAAHHAVRLLDGTVLVLAGGDLLAGTAEGTSEIYDPAANTWTLTGSMVVARGQPAVIRLADGRVLAAAGGGSPTTAEIYDPTTKIWSSTTGLATPRRAFGGALLPTGKAIVIGGNSGPPNNEYHTTVEIFDPASKLWSFGPPTAHQRAEAAIELLDDGFVLAVGGIGGAAAGSTAEVYRAGEEPSGTACLGGAACLTGFCVDGFCCDTACNGECVACSAAAKVSGVNGVCGPAKMATDPHGTCIDDGPVSCAKNGLCDGAGACAKYPVATGCAPRACATGTDCASGFCVDGICCDKTCDGPCEACTALRKGSGAEGVCGPIAAGAVPRGQCAVDSGFPTSCRADGLCDGAGACRAFAAKGTVCGLTSCADGVQKTPACDGAGVCALSDVPCAPLTCASDGKTCSATCTMDTECPADARCSAGKCAPKKPLGAPATEPRDCSSGVIADGVCCNVACTGVCETCNGAATNGTCTAAKGAAVHGTCPAAASADPCAGATCDGVSRTACTGLPASDQICRAAGCSEGVEISEARCDGKGTCPALAVRKCAPYACAGATCASACAADAECSAGNRCDAATKICSAPEPPAEGGCAVASSPRAPSGWRFAIGAGVIAVCLARRRRPSVSRGVTLP